MALLKQKGGGRSSAKIYDIIAKKEASGNVYNFNLKTIFPDVDIKELTLNNFIICPNTCSVYPNAPAQQEEFVGGPAGYGVRLQATYCSVKNTVNNSFTISYDQTTGILTCSQSIDTTITGSGSTSYYNNGEGSRNLSFTSTKKTTNTISIQHVYVIF